MDKEPEKSFFGLWEKNALLAYKNPSRLTHLIFKKTL